LAHDAVQTLAVGRRLLAEAHALMNAATTPQRLSVFFLARATQAFNAVEILFAAGLPLDATSNLRTLIELAIDFHFLWHTDTDARTRLYIEYIHVANRKKLEAHERIFGPTDPQKEEAAFVAIAAHAPPGVTDAASMRAYIEAEYQRIKPNYPRLQWHQSNIRDRAVEVQLDHFYDLIHRRGSEASHSNAAALAPFYTIAGNVLSVSADPETPDEVLPLAMALLIYQAFAWQICAKIGRGDVPELDALTADVNFAIANLASR
jgi:hypothetical protein